MSAERTELQRLPVKLYRTADIVTVAAPMPGLEAENIAVDVTGDDRLVLRGQLRGALKDVKELLLDEWSVGPYHREVALPCPVDGENATVTYGNGVLVVALPVAERTRPAQLALESIAPTRGERVPDQVAEGGHGHAGMKPGRA
jgi:HSP20 family protein